MKSVKDKNLFFTFQKMWQNFPCLRSAERTEKLLYLNPILIFYFFVFAPQPPRLKDSYTFQVKYVFQLIKFEMSLIFLDYSETLGDIS